MICARKEGKEAALLKLFFLCDLRGITMSSELCVAFGLLFFDKEEVTDGMSLKK